MPYKYLDYGTEGYPPAPKQQWRTGFQALLTEQFENASSYQEIYEETVFGSGDFYKTGVRINRAINSSNGEKLGDDFKQILFRDLDHATGIGYKYYFDDNYWITAFSEIIMSLGATCLVRRCNTRLRWMGTDGVYYEEPCAIEYKISRPRDSMGTENPVLPQGFVDVYAQLNDRTRLIKSNQRFLFGPPENRICLKVFGTGIQNALNQQTLDDTSSRLVTYSMGGNYVNKDTDDLELGIADKYLNIGYFTSASMANNYSVIINPPNCNILESGSAVYNVQYYQGLNPVSGSFVFSVSGSAVPVASYAFATIDGNNFSVVNNSKWLDNTLDIVATGASGSRIFNIGLRGAF